jgi:hypothetical protein
MTEISPLTDEEIEKLRRLEAAQLAAKPVWMHPVELRELIARTNHPRFASRDDAGCLLREFARYAAMTREAEDERQRDQRTVIPVPPIELIIWVGERLATWAAGSMPLDRALLGSKRGRKKTSMDRMTEIAVTIQSYRLLDDKSHEESVEKAREAHGCGDTVAAEAWVAYRDNLNPHLHSDVDSAIRLERAVNRWSMRNDVIRGVDCRLFLQ